MTKEANEIKLFTAEEMKLAEAPESHFEIYKIVGYYGFQDYWKCWKNDFYSIKQAEDFVKEEISQKHYRFLRIFKLAN